MRSALRSLADLTFTSRPSVVWSMRIDMVESWSSVLPFISTSYCMRLPARIRTSIFLSGERRLWLDCAAALPASHRQGASIKESVLGSPFIEEDSMRHSYHKLFWTAMRGHGDRSLTLAALIGVALRRSEPRPGSPRGRERLPDTSIFFSSEGRWVVWWAGLYPFCHPRPRRRT